MKKFLVFIALLWATAALAADNPIACTGASCKVSLTTDTSGRMNLKGTSNVSALQLRVSDFSSASIADWSLNTHSASLGTTRENATNGGWAMVFDTRSSSNQMTIVATPAGSSTSTAGNQIGLILADGGWTIGSATASVHTIQGNNNVVFKNGAGTNIGSFSANTVVANADSNANLILGHTSSTGKSLDTSGDIDFAGRLYSTVAAVGAAGAERIHLESTGDFYALGFFSDNGAQRGGLAFLNVTSGGNSNISMFTSVSAGFGSPVPAGTIDADTGTWSFGTNTVSPSFTDRIFLDLSSSVTIGMQIRNLNAGANAGAHIQFTSDGGGAVLFRTSIADGERFIARNETGGANLAVGATAWAAVSDERVKRDWEEITGALDKIGTLRAGTYEQIDLPGIRKVGLIAQDVLKVQPEAVEQANPNRLELRYTEVLPLAIKAIQELKAENEALKARLDAAGL